MRCAKKARRSRRSATTGLDAKACVLAASRISHTTVAPDPVRTAFSETLPLSANAKPNDAAEILFDVNIRMVAFGLCRIGLPKPEAPVGKNRLEQRGGTAPVIGGGMGLARSDVFVRVDTSPPSRGTGAKPL